jgi:excisionase family DNA binding protein
VLTVEELSEYFRIGKSTAYELTKLRGFPVIHVGSKKMVIPKRKLAEWIDKQTAVGKSAITPAVAQGIRLLRKESI